MSLADELRARAARRNRMQQMGPKPAPESGAVRAAAAASAASAAEVRVVPEKRYAAIAWVLAAGVVAIALILNYLSSPVVVGGSLNNGGSGVSAMGRGATAVVNLPTQPAKMLPNQIEAYEVIDSHVVPGSDRTAAEAIYQTYNMNLTLQVPITVYAHVQGYATAAAAQEALSQMMAKYPVKQGTRLVGPIQPGQTGYLSDESAYVVGWAKGRYVTYVRTFFSDHAPAQKRDFLSANGEPVTLAVEEYQRTGWQGAQANADIYKSQPKVKAPKQSTTPTSAPSGFGGEILGAP